MTQQPHLRLWPSVVIVLLVASYVIPMFVPEAFLWGMIGGLVAAFSVLVWWVFSAGRSGSSAWAPSS